jgi:PiT family inorganic phosphate transporter
MDDNLALLVIIIVAALGFGFSNGLNDAANAIATAVGSRVLSPRTAIYMAAASNIAGTLSGAFLGAYVAKTIGKGIVAPEAMTLAALFSGVLGATIWVLFATRQGIPLSVSHSLVAGILGAGIGAAGTGHIVWGVLTKVFLAVIFAPLLGFAGGFGLMVLIMWLFRRSPPDRITSIFSKVLIAASAFVAYAHGKNDGQMPIAIIALALMIHYGKDQFDIPMWVIFVSAISVALGIIIGGWRVIRTIGTRITVLRPVHASAAQASAAAVIEAASNLGIPVSTTQCISGAVMGVGATKRLSAVRWGVARSIMAAWVLTFPICIALGWLLEKLLGLFA